MALRGALLTLRAQVAIEQGRVPEALELAREADQLLPPEAYGMRSTNGLVRGYALMVLGQTDEAIEVYAANVRVCREAGNAVSGIFSANEIIKLRHLQGRLRDALAAATTALAWGGGGRLGAAATGKCLAHLAGERADRAGEAGGRRRGTGDRLPPDAGRDYHPAQPYLRRLLAAFPTGGGHGRAVEGQGAPVLRPTPERANALREALTEREREVLRLFAAGMTSAEISQQFVVSVNTVKAQLKMGKRTR
ncbi:MAG: hypothetical protein OHK0015_28160 [Chloroflexi bacterium OHK40]